MSDVGISVMGNRKLSCVPIVMTCQIFSLFSSCIFFLKARSIILNWTLCYLTSFRYVNLSFLITGICGFFLSLMSYVFVDISRQKPADSHSWKTLFLQYFIMSLLKKVGAMYYKQLTSASNRVKPVQEELLLSVLKKNSDTMYGRQYN